MEAKEVSRRRSSFRTHMTHGAVLLVAQHTILDEVRSSCKAFVSESKVVSINESKLQAFADTISLQEVSSLRMRLTRCCSQSMQLHAILLIWICIWDAFSSPPLPS